LIKVQTLINANILEEQKYITSFPPKCSFAIPSLDFQDIKTHAPNLHYLLVRDASHIVGRCSLWWENTPSLPNHQIGLIGHYAVSDAAAATSLLDAACSQLKASGCTLAVAPMDGNTWNSYRLLVERGKHPVFFLEPDNPDNWQQHFSDRSFKILANYRSAVNTNLAQSDNRLQKVSQRLNSIGISIRSVDLNCFESELEKIYEVAIQSFKHNFLFTPISETEFMTQYHFLLPYIQPELVLIAEYQGDPVGFIFAIPDFIQKMRGEKIDTMIIKTVAILPHRIYAGLGNLLVAKCQEIAHQHGYSQAIHALMHDGNPSVNLSQHYAQSIRKYSLFAKELGI
jgi:hypothetical protein